MYIGGEGERGPGGVGGGGGEGWMVLGMGVCIGGWRGTRGIGRGRIRSEADILWARKRGGTQVIGEGGGVETNLVEAVNKRGGAERGRGVEADRRG